LRESARRYQAEYDQLNQQVTAEMQTVAEQLQQMDHKLNSILDSPTAAPAHEHKSIWQLAQEIIENIPEEELRLLPRDGTVNHDHYIYGTPKVEP
jgi:ferritin-like metal-binding protein YciE